MQKLFGHPGSDPKIASILERAYQSGSNINRSRNEQARMERQLILDRGTSVLEQMLRSTPSDEKLELARSSLERQLAAQDDIIAKFAPPDAAEMAAIRKKHQALQISAESSSSSETSPCLVIKKQPKNIWGDVRYYGLRIEVERARHLSNREEISEFLRQHGDCPQMVIRMPAKGDDHDRALFVATDYLLTKFMDLLERENLELIKDGITLMPCRPIYIDEPGILNISYIWDQVLKNGGAKHIDRCPDIYNRRLDVFKDSRYFLDAKITEEKLRTFAGSFTAEYPHLEALIGARVDAVLNGPVQESQKVASQQINVAQDQTEPFDPFERKRPLTSETAFEI